MNDAERSKADLLRELTEARKTISDLEATINASQSPQYVPALAQHTVESSNIPILWVRHDSSILFANLAQCEMLGYQQSELHSMHVADFDPNWTEDFWVQTGWPGIKERGQWTFESLNQRKDGTVFPVEVTATYGVFDDEEYVFAFTSDISRRKQNQAILQESEARFRAFTENTTAVTVILNADGQHTYVSPAVSRITGYEISNFYGKTPADFVHPDDMPKVKASIATAMQNPGTATPLIDMRLIHRDGRWVYLNGVVVDMIDVAGVNGLVYNGLDVTERRHLEKEAQQAEILRVELEKEKEVVALKDRFVSIVSHEFRNPLAVIQTSSDILKLHIDKLTHQQQLSKLEQIHRQVEYLTDLIDNTLALSSARQNNLEFTPTPVDIEQFCLDILEQIQVINTGRYDFRFESRLTRTQVMVDKKLLQHILTNLLTNAVKYTPEDKNISFDLYSEAETIIFKIADEGIGIPAADLTRLFEPFHRAENVGSVRGTGLGLSIVKDYVELHGGTIEVESKVGEGSTFIVTLPI